MNARYETLVVHGAGLTPQEELTEKAAQRMDTAISVWGNDDAEYMIVSGKYSFMLDTPPSVTEASVMKKYAIKKGVPAGRILSEEESRDTIGNALFTNTDILIPNGFRGRTGIVTSISHLQRTLDAFQHVIGEGSNITGIPAPEDVTLKDKVYERIAGLVMQEVLRGTNPGDDEAIRDRLFNLVPGYAEGTKRRLAAQSLLGVFKRR